MTEYEYSFKAKDIKPYINYCEENNFKKVEETMQTRILYKNPNNVLARITTQEHQGNVSSYINFKDQNETEEILKVSKETPPLNITEENKSFVLSMLNILQYKEDKILKRKRYIYEKNNVKFEIDDYTSPEKMYVVAIEGEKTQVDSMYDEIRKIFGDNMIIKNEE